MVRRPSTRITPKFSELSTSGSPATGPRSSSVSGFHEEKKEVTASAVPKDELTSATAEGSPQMPVLKTFKWVEKTASLSYQSPLLRQQLLQEDELTRSVVDFPVKLEASRYNAPNDMSGTPPTPGKQTIGV